VVAGFAGVVDEACAADVHAAGKECHAQGFVVGDALEGADDVGPLEVLYGSLVYVVLPCAREVVLPSNHASIDLSAHLTPPPLRTD
jgi:hypothetical protein